MLLPMEGDRWILSIAGLNGETPPTDDVEALTRCIDHVVQGLS